MILSKDKVYRLAHSNAARVCIAIQNKNPVGYIFLLKSEEEYEHFEQHGFAIKNGRRLVLQGVDCYKGGFFVATDTNDTDVRMLDL